jgi:hypothetical protein
MTAQRHIIKRQVLELQISSMADAQQLQTAVSRVYRQCIVPLIERYCNELSTPERIHRIDLLELNLGTVDLQHLEADLVAKVSTQLRVLLADHIIADEHKAENAGTNRQTASYLELFGVFAQTGSLPWWTDASPPHLLDDCLQHLIHHAPGPLRQLMRELAQEQRFLQRIVQHLDDRLLADLAAVLAPSLDLAALAHLAGDLVLVLRGMPSGAHWPQTRLRHLIWNMIMHRVSLQEAYDTAWSPFLHAVLIRVAAELGVAYTALLSGMQQVVQQDHPHFQSPIREILETLYTEVNQGEGVQRQTGLLPLLRALAAQLPEHSQVPLLATLDHLARSPRDQEAVTALLHLLRSALVYQPLAPRLITRWRAVLEELAMAEFSPGRVQVVTELLQAVLQQIHSPLAREARLEIRSRRQSEGSSGAPETAQTPLDFTFSNTDALYIGNAGLVILHPFLYHFFARLTLLEDRQFTDMAARQRAVGLLQYVVSEDPSAPEYLLPLNKTLCGMELDDVFDFGPPVTEAEAEECTNLLTAVIANAPILKNMSINGLRGTFLLRQGMLSNRDGVWLLRVERETYDVVLDRFPWTMQWVKLPWMDTPLRVEW